jgi:hypothetical protein
MIEVGEEGIKLESLDSSTTKPDVDAFYVLHRSCILDCVAHLFLSLGSARNTDAKAMLVNLIRIIAFCGVTLSM